MLTVDYIVAGCFLWRRKKKRNSSHQRKSCAHVWFYLSFFFLINCMKDSRWVYNVPEQSLVRWITPIAYYDRNFTAWLTTGVLTFASQPFRYASTTFSFSPTTAGQTVGTRYTTCNIASSPSTISSAAIQYSSSAISTTTTTTTTILEGNKKTNNNKKWGYRVIKKYRMNEAKNKRLKCSLLYDVVNWNNFLICTKHDEIYQQSFLVSTVPRMSTRH